MILANFKPLFPHIIMVVNADQTLYNKIINEVNNCNDDITKLLKENTWDDNVYTTYKGTRDILTHLNLKNLKQFIDAGVQDYLQAYPYYQNKKVVLEQSWINVTKKYGFQDFHVHNVDGPCISGVFYINTSGEDGYLQFMPSFQHQELMGFHGEKPENGKLVVFDGSFIHRVMYNKTETSRVSLSFNYKFVS